jgi:hypothetical protein
MKATFLSSRTLAIGLFALVLGIGPQAPGASAQVGGVRCESVDSQYRECQYFADGTVRLSRQLSDSPCIQGRTWDYDGNRRRIWVAQGCRADFIVEGGGRFGATPFQQPFGRQPQITTLRNGDTEVGFDSGCTVVFDRSGRRTYYRPNCNGEEVRVADDAMRGGRGQGNFFEGRPEVMMGQGGGEVLFRNNNCVVYYDSRRRRTTSRQECTSAQLRQADQEIANYR